MSVLPDSLAGWIVVAVLLFWFVGAYNRLVRLRAAVLQAYATLDAALARQLDFVQASLSAPSVAEESTEPAVGASSLQAATTQMATLLGATRQRPLEAGSMSALATALQVLLALAFAGEIALALVADAVDLDAEAVEARILAVDHTAAFRAQQVEQRAFEDAFEHRIAFGRELFALGRIIHLHSPDAY